MANVNEQVLRDALGALAGGDPGPYMAFYDEDAVLHYPGRNPLSGDYQGKEAIGGFFAKMMETTDGTFGVASVHDVVANDEHALAMVALTAQRKSKSHRWNAVLVFHAREGRASEAWVFEDDQYVLDDLLS